MRLAASGSDGGRTVELHSGELLWMSGSSATDLMHMVSLCSCSATCAHLCLLVIDLPIAGGRAAGFLYTAFLLHSPGSLAVPARPAAAGGAAARDQRVGIHAPSQQAAGGTARAAQRKSTPNKWQLQQMEAGVPLAKLCVLLCLMLCCTHGAHPHTLYCRAWHGIDHRQRCF